MIKFLAIAIFATIFIGCSASKPVITEYRVNYTPQKKLHVESTCRDKSLKIARAFSSNSLMSSSMRYIENNKKEYSFAESKWAISPNIAIGAKLLTIFRESEIFKDVQTAKSRGKKDIILETNIEEFIQYFDSKDNRSYAKAVISLTLLEAKNSSIIASKTFFASIFSKTFDAAGGVDALNDALSKILNESNIWVREVCK